MPNSALISLVTRTQATPTLYNNLVKDARRLLAVTGGTKTISSGSITVVPGDGEGFYLVDTEGAAASDELDTISGGANGDVIALRQANSARNVMVRSGFGNILLKDDAPLPLSHVQALLFRYDGSNWMPVGGAGAGGANMTNKSGGTVLAGDVVVFDTENDTAFKTTTVKSDMRVCGVALADIADNASGSIITGAGDPVTVNCDSAAVARGQFLVSSTTAGKATSGSHFREAGVFAIAMTSKAGGSAGTVQAMLVDNFRQAIIGTAGWNMGGRATTTVQKFLIATETWSTVAGAALPAARNRQCGLSYGTVAGYSTHGTSTNTGTEGDQDTNRVATRYKTSYSTETTSTLANSSDSRNRHRSGVNFSDKGFMVGGNTTSTVSTTRRTTFATDAEASGNNLSSSRIYQGGISDGTYCYVGGSTSVNTDRLDQSTETFALTGTAALANFVDGYCFISFPSAAGYRVYNNGSGTSYSRKLNYATATDANNGSSASGNIAHGSQVTDGVAVGYASGLSAANRLSSNTDTYSSLTDYPANTQGSSASYAAL